MGTGLLAETIRDLLAQNQFKEVFKLLKPLLKGKLLDELVCVQGRWNRANRDRINGIIFSEEYTRECVQTSSHLLVLLEFIDQNKHLPCIPDQAVLICEEIQAQYNPVPSLKALFRLEQLIWEFPNFGQALILAGIGYALHGRPDFAIYYLKRAKIWLKPNDSCWADLYTNLGSAYFQKGRLNKAFSNWHKAAERGSAVAGMWLNYLAPFVNL